MKMHHFNQTEIPTKLPSLQIGYSVKSQVSLNMQMGICSF